MIGCLDTLPITKPVQKKAVLPVQWVSRPNASFRAFSGTLASGQLKIGAPLRITASGQTATLAQIVSANGEQPITLAGEAVTLVLDREVDASRGDMIALADQPLDMTDQFEVTLVWLHDEPGHIGRIY